MQLTFNDPIYLWYLATIPILIAAHFYFLRYAKHRGLQFANFDALQRLDEEQVLTKNYTLLGLRVLALVCLIFAMSGATVWYQGATSDTDYVLAIDTSASMTAKDVEPTRLEAAQNTVRELMQSLESQGIEAGLGVLSFSGSTYIETRVTEDYTEVRRALGELTVREEGGTDLSGAIVTGVNILAGSDDKSIILFSDGGATTNPESDSMQNALQYAQDERVTVHTVGLGSDEGPVGYLPEYYNASATFERETLLNLANSTQGDFRSVGGNNTDIAGLIETSTEESPVDQDLTSGLLIVGVFLVFLEWGLANTKFRRLP